MSRAATLPDASRSAAREPRASAVAAAGSRSLGGRIRRLRDIAMKAMLLRRRSPEQDGVIAGLRIACAAQPLAITVAFNTPGVIAIWIERMRRLAPGTALLVCDNSNKPRASAAIRLLCASAGVPYCTVPSLPVPMRRNGSRSHGMAMTWIFHVLVRAIRPAVFAFLDHDLFPVTPVALAPLVATQDVYGLGSRDAADLSRAWSLWAGFSVFRFAPVAGHALDFLADHPLGLDTGGQNWHRLFKPMDRRGLRFARRYEVTVPVPCAPPVTFEVIDGFAHLRDASRRFAGGESFGSLEAGLTVLERRIAAAGPRVSADRLAEGAAPAD